MSRVSWHRATALALALLLPAAAAVAAAPSANALAKIKCHQTVGVASVDPIVFHNQTTTMAHSHQFFGNNGWLAKGNRANYGDLMGAGHTGQVFDYITFRDSKANENESYAFQPQPEAIQPTRIAFIARTIELVAQRFTAQIAGVAP